MDEIEIPSKEFDEATSTQNVRSKVSSWLTGVIDEFRRKSPRTIQKWVDQSTTLTEKEAQPTTSADEEIFTSTRESKSELLHFKNLNKAKFSEFYEKVVCQNNKLVNLRKFQNMEDHEKKEATPILNSEAYQTCTENISTNNLEIVVQNEATNYTKTTNFIEPNKANNLETNEELTDISNCSTNLKIPIKFIKEKSLSLDQSENQQNNNDMLNDKNNGNDYAINKRSRSFTHEKNEDNNIFSNVIEQNDQNNKPLTFGNSLPNYLEKSKNQITNSNNVKSHRELILELEKCKSTLLRDNSYQSDSSHCSSVDSLLESRKPDPEAILLSCGFGPVDSGDILERIPKRFLQPSQVRGIDTQAFVKKQQMANHIHDHTVLGYRGLIGNPDMPPSMIVAKIIERFEMNELNGCCKDMNKI